MSQNIRRNGVELDENGFAIKRPKNKDKKTKVLPNDLKTCLKCRRIFGNTGSEDYITCLDCRTAGKHLHLDDIDISHSIYPEKNMSKDLKKCPKCNIIWKRDDGIWEKGTPWDSDTYEICPKCSKMAYDSESD